MSTPLIVHPVAMILRDLIRDFMGYYAGAVRLNRVAGQDVAAAAIEGLSAIVALQVVGGHGSREEIESACIAKLRECVQRDLQHLARQ